MTDVREDVLAELENRDDTLRLDDFVRIIESHHATRRGATDGDDRSIDRGPRGVDRETLAAYAEAVRFDVDLAALDDRVVDSDDWVEGGRFYDFGGDRISVYPPDWHDAIADTDDIRHVVRVIQDETTEVEGDHWGAVTEDRGVPEEKVFRVAETVAGIDREAAREQIKELRQSGEIEEFASQNRNPTIRLS
ncbi:hypothetical protein NGM10_15150 [Halorussus salilacus]|uniref:hypothetical protein n=1 Tax=Halorussus salilacus TaxID=2953750 RepID=UPI00209E0BF9|nr:hypothetical protein [Halorussus salilacus]USZ68057.1 hypothetical protein NGM10_15150 [Halorussus salilacus]